MLKRRRYTFICTKWSLIITICFINRRKLEYAAQYDATKIAVINIKDLDGVKNAINVILPEESKIFQCISATTKVKLANLS